MRSTIQSARANELLAASERAPQRIYIKYCASSTRKHGWVKMRWKIDCVRYVARAVCPLWMCLCLQEHEHRSILELSLSRTCKLCSPACTSSCITVRPFGLSMTVCDVRAWERVRSYCLLPSVVELHSRLYVLSLPSIFPTFSDFYWQFVRFYWLSYAVVSVYRALVQSVHRTHVESGGYSQLDGSSIARDTMLIGWRD